MNVRFVWVAGVSLLTAALAIGSEKLATDDETNAAVNAIADKLEKGDKEGAKKAVADLAKADLEDVMHAFKLRKQKGIGVGKNKDEIQPDGIELKINAIARDGITVAALKKEGPALVRAAYVTGAIAQVALAKTPEKDEGKKKKSDWVEFATAMSTVSQEFAAAAKADDAPALKKAANKLKQQCDSCHMVFK
jgi:hypothetical protein